MRASSFQPTLITTMEAAYNNGVHGVDGPLGRLRLLPPCRRRRHDRIQHPLEGTRRL